MGYNPMLRELGRFDLVIRDGEAAIPERPGLGVTIDEDFVREYTHRAGE